MSAEIAFLSVDQLLAIHRRGIEDHGGSPELRDRGLLESAAAMPKAQFGGHFLHDGLPAMAAAYLFHLCKNHPFVDGNKRVAISAAEIFVLLNGYELVATDDVLGDLTLGVADSSISKDDATAFFRKHVRSAKSVEAKRRAAAKPAKRSSPRRKKSS